MEWTHRARQLQEIFCRQLSRGDSLTSQDWENLKHQFPEFKFFIQLAAEIWESHPSVVSSIIDKTISLQDTLTPTEVLELALSGNLSPQNAREFFQSCCQSLNYFRRFLMLCQEIEETLKETQSSSQPLEEQESLPSTSVTKDLSSTSPTYYRPAAPEKGARRKKTRVLPFKPVLDQIAATPIKWVAAAVIIVGFLGILFWWQGTPPQEFARLNFDDRVPYEYLSPFLRGEDKSMTEDGQLQQFVHRVLLAIGDYSLRHYEVAIQEFEMLQQQAQQLARSPLEEKARPWLVRYYFYQGLTHMAYASTRKVSLTSEQRQAHLRKAVASLQKVSEFEPAPNVAEARQVHYFLGLCFYYLGDLQQAQAHLSKVSPESPFFSSAHRLLSLIKK